MDYREFKSVCSRYHLEVTEELYGSFETYAQYLVEYNERVNLTAITERREVYIKHFLDSLIPLTYVDVPQGATLIDVGTGAGFPSVPMKLYRPDLKLTLLDSLNKRIVFLESLCDRLGIEVECVHGRAEDFGRDGRYRERFDYATARAVANLRVLSEYCLPFVRVGGAFIAMKGLSEDVTLADGAIKTLGGEVTDDVSYTVPPEDSRRIVVVSKVASTPKKYPRTGGKVQSRPL